MRKVGRRLRERTGRSSVNDQLRRIESVTDAALAHLGLEELLHELVDRVRELLQVDTAAVLLIDLHTQQLVATAASGIEEEVRQGVRVPIGKGFAGRIAAQKQPMIIDRVGPSNVVNPLLVDKGIHSLLGVPMLVEGTILGVMHVGTLAARRFIDRDVQLLQLVADRIALATQASVSEAGHTAAAALQRTLLPAHLPTVPGLEFASRYVPGERIGVGGDWYDLFMLPSGGLGVVIGDVVGRGLGAAVVMSRLRSALRAYALDDGDPDEVLDKLDRKVQHFEPDVMATVLYATLEPSLERLQLSSAGHLPPVLAPPSGPPVFLDVPIDIPLGLRMKRQRHTSTIELPPGALMCFYTDGLVERRGNSVNAALERLRTSVVPGPAESVCAAVMSALTNGNSPNDDDVAVLTLSRRHRPLELEIPAEAESLWNIRAKVRRWLAEIGAAPQDVQHLLVAIGEACTNAVKHAYGPTGSGTVAVHVELRSSDVIATIRDTGAWHSPNSDNRGLGIPLMRRCIDHVHIDHRPTGTEVLLRHQLGRQSTR
jgi:serine phosphatase RsbU (regulator of sigma subunit)/anti-sigma regulatory factor (Ser/Thr protein kinase)